MSRLFKASAAITLTQPAEGSLTRLRSSTSVTVRDLRMQFAVDKNLGKEPNTCTVTVTNFSSESRALCQVKPLHVYLEAGFDGNTQRLFAGDVIFAQSLRHGSDWDTEIQVGDGSRAFRHARSSKSFARGVKARKAILQVIGDLGFNPPSDMPDISGEFSAGLVVDGPSQRELSRLLEPFGYTWSIQDGRIQIQRDRDTRRDAPILISEDTGMIGSPEYGDPPRKGKPPTLHVESQLYPALTPGGRIEVRSRLIRGLFKIRRVTHTGDTHGPDPISRVEATPV